MLWKSILLENERLLVICVGLSDSEPPNAEHLGSSTMHCLYSTFIGPACQKPIQVAPVCGKFSFYYFFVGVVFYYWCVV